MRINWVNKTICSGAGICSKISAKYIIIGNKNACKVLLIYKQEQMQTQDNVWWFSQSSDPDHQIKTIYQESVFSRFLDFNFWWSKSYLSSLSVPPQSSPTPGIKRSRPATYNPRNYKETLNPWPVFMVLWESLIFPWKYTRSLQA